MLVNSEDSDQMPQKIWVCAVCLCLIKRMVWPDNIDPRRIHFGQSLHDICVFFREVLRPGPRFYREYEDNIHSFLHSDELLYRNQKHAFHDDSRRLGER